MYWVFYYCPKQSPFWQRRNTPIQTLAEAMLEAEMVKPGGMGRARVDDRFGRTVFEC